MIGWICYIYKVGHLCCICPLFTKLEHHNVCENELLAYIFDCASMMFFVIPHFRLAVMDPLLEANATFALKVLRVLGEDSSKNVFFSPLSMFSSLSMILLGANGTTASQISKVTSTMVKQINTVACQLNWTFYALKSSCR